MGKLFSFYTWEHIKAAAWLFRRTRHECNKCCLWCEFFKRCYWDCIYEQLKEAARNANGE